MANSAFVISTPTFQIKLFKHRSFQLRSRFQIRERYGQFTRAYFTKAIAAEFGDSGNGKLRLNLEKEKLQNAVKEFPWKKVENQILQRTFSVGKKVLKWSCVTLFVISFCSDIVFSIARNKEMLIPIGLFVGCITTDFLKEVSQELLDNSQETSSSWKLAGICCFFVLAKFISVFLPLQAHIFLLNFANGGLMQVLWVWVRSLQRNNGENEENQTTLEI